MSRKIRIELQPMGVAFDVERGTPVEDVISYAAGFSSRPGTGEGRIGQTAGKR